MLRIGALARHRRFERPVAPGPLGEPTPRVARHVGHLPIRTRGTFCGSLAHADPAAEWCLAALVLDGRDRGALDARRAGHSRRRVLRHGFHHRPAARRTCSSRCASLSSPTTRGWVRRAQPAGWGLRTGDGDGGASHRRRPYHRCPTRRRRGGRSSAAPPRGRGRSDRRDASRAVFERAAEIAASSVRPLEDIHAGAEYRRSLVSVLLVRALRQAAA